MVSMKNSASETGAAGTKAVPRQWHSASWAMLGLVAPTALQLVYMIFAARLLGATLAGNFFLIVSVATIASSFAGLGSGGMTMRDTARDHASAPIALGRAQAMTLATFPFLLIPVLLVSRYVTHDTVSVLIICLVASAELVAMRAMTTCWTMFIAREEQVRGSLLICAMPLCRLMSIMVVLLYPAGERLNVFCYAYVLSSFAVLLGGHAYVMTRIGRLHFTLSNFDTRSGISFSLTWLNQSLQTESDKIILSLFSTPAMVAVYAVASRLMDGAAMPPRAIKTAIQPRLFREGVSGPTAAYRITVKILPITVGYGLVAWLGFAVTSPLVVMIFGPEYAALGRILPIFGALPLFRAISDFGAEIFQSSDQPGIQAMTQTFATVLRVGIGFMLIAPYKLEGAVATALTVNVVSASILWFIAWRATRADRQPEAPVGG